MANHEIILSNSSGLRLASLESAREINYTRVLNGIGVCKIMLPENFDTSPLAVDGRLEVWRAPEGQHQSLGFYGLVRRWVSETDENGLTSLAVYAMHLNELLKRRIIAYAAGSAQANKTAKLDDMMKAIVRENLGSLANANRDWSAQGFSVQADLGLGPTKTKGFAWRNVLMVLQELSDTAVNEGTPIYFEIIYTSPTSFEFQTFLNVRGMDHSLTSAQPVVVGVEFGTLAQPSLDSDYGEEVSHVYAGGQQEEAARTIVEVSDTAREGTSPFNRREGFADARNESTTAGVTAAAQAALQAGRPVRRFGGNIIDTPGARYGIEWDFGDKVTTSYRGLQYTALIRAITVSVDAQGNERVAARLEVTN